MDKGKDYFEQQLLYTALLEWIDAFEKQFKNEYKSHSLDDCFNMGIELYLPLIKEWLNSDCANVRRAVSEGLRVWTSRPYFKDNPQMAIQLLSAHREDTSEYVRKSAGNALRDISKKHPELISAELNSWDLSSKRIKQVYKLAAKFLI